MAKKYPLGEIPIDKEGMTDTYLIQRLEDKRGYFHWSFSNRYMNWKIRRSITKSLKEKLRENKRKNLLAKILEVGCFEGDLIFKLKSLLDEEYNLDFIGIDLSPQAIDFANKRKGFLKAKNCQFKVMDANEMQFEDSQFDIVICSEVIEHIEHPMKALREIYRVLKKEGLAIITTPNKGGGVIAKLGRLANFISFNAIRIKREREIEKCIKGKELSDTMVVGKRAEGEGFGHISVKDHLEWSRIIRQIGFKIQRKMGTGGMLFGDVFLDEHRILFGLLVIMDTVLEPFPQSYLWSEILLLELRR